MRRSRRRRRRARRLRAHARRARARARGGARGVEPLDEAGGPRVVTPRILCVFGCGGDRDPSKRAPMGEAVGARADVAIVTSDNPRTESTRGDRRARRGGRRVAPGSRSSPAGHRRGAEGLPRRARSRSARSRSRSTSARPGDVVLIAGKGHEDYQIIGTDEAPVRRSRRGAARARGRAASAKPESR